MVCGGNNQSCCSSKPECSPLGEMGCYHDTTPPMCHPCGVQYMELCPDGTCRPGFKVQQDGTCLAHNDQTCGDEGMPCCQSPVKACQDPYVCQTDGWISGKDNTCQISTKNCGGRDQLCCLDRAESVEGCDQGLTCQGGDWSHSVSGVCQQCDGCVSHSQCDDAYRRCMAPSLAGSNDMRERVTDLFQTCSTALKCKLNQGYLQESVQAGKLMQTSGMSNPPDSQAVKAFKTEDVSVFSTFVCMQYLGMFAELDPAVAPMFVSVEALSEIRYWQSLATESHWGLAWDYGTSNWIGSRPCDLFARQITDGFQIKDAAKKQYEHTEFGFDKYRNMCNVAVMEPQYNASKYACNIGNDKRAEVDSYAKAPGVSW